LLERFRVNLGLSAGREACARFWKEAVLAKPREPREPREPWQVAQWAMAVLDNIDARNALMARIQYGGGLRLKELVSLRVQGRGRKPRDHHHPGDQGGHRRWK
jgi:integrase